MTLFLTGFLSFLAGAILVWIARGYEVRRLEHEILGLLKERKILTAQRTVLMRSRE